MAMSGEVGIDFLYMYVSFDKFCSYFMSVIIINILVDSSESCQEWLKNWINFNVEKNDLPEINRHLQIKWVANFPSCYRINKTTILFSSLEDYK